jgi:hydrogenase maturation protein HypF
MTERWRFRVRGTVQGVGFRPFVHRHAVGLGLAGWVRNDTDGVLIEVEGAREQIEALRRRLDRPPRLARVGQVVASPVAREGAVAGFEILDSVDLGPPGVPVGVDTAPCDACVAELRDPADRRHRYPFGSCTDCGPRYTIVRSVPYDRANTTMAGFAMCPRCQQEHDDPGDRRFHAQPNACWTCGPQATWRDPSGDPRRVGDAAVRSAVGALLAAEVVAVKGVGGYHLVADATSDAAVGALRRRKARDHKPFAVMVPDLDAARRLCHLGPAAVEALASHRRPIVLAPRRADAEIAGTVAPGLPELGVMLPYSPLHQLLLDDAGRALVMTSGNVSDEPIAHDDDDAVVRLGPLVDGLLTHDRPIHVRCDDSVARATGPRVQLLRRSRGHVPEPLTLPFDATGACVLAVGGELKSTIAVTRGRDVIASGHLGDLEHLATHRSFLQAVEHLPALCGVAPDVVAHDLHPEYLSTKWAMELDVALVGVQHHHAHAAACLVDHGRTAPVVALCFDGLGYGPDGTMWGGEVLVADLGGFERAGHLLPVVMPGGTAAIREPWRMATSWLTSTVGADAAVEHLHGVDERAAAVVALSEQGRGPVTTSVGRLFDAVAALLGARSVATYEAQAAIELEAAARQVPRPEAPTYDGAIAVGPGADDVLVLDPRPLIQRLLDDLGRGLGLPVLAAGFHEALGRAAAAAALEVADRAGLDAVALTGGVFQNARLTEVTESALLAAGIEVLVHEQVPANDGGLSIGQAAIAAWTAVPRGGEAMGPAAGGLRR